jgi:speckle-type POZ protein
MIADKVRISEWKVGQRLINWQLFDWPEEELDSAGWHRISAMRKLHYEDDYYVMFFAFGSPCLMLVFYFKSKVNRPKQIIAVIDGKMVPLTESESGYWGPLRYKNAIKDDGLPVKELYMKNYPHQWPHFQFILDFEDKPSDKTMGERLVLQNLSRLLETRSMADVAFTIKDQEIKAHSAIVASASPVFRAMFQQDPSEEVATKTAVIDDMEPAVFQQLLRYLYTGDVDFRESSESLFLAADKYQIDSLKRQCEQHLIDNLSAENAVRRLVLAHLHSSPTAVQRVIHFLTEHKEQVWCRPEWRELVQTHPDLFFLVAHKMVIAK